MSRAARLRCRSGSLRRTRIFALGFFGVPKCSGAASIRIHGITCSSIRPCRSRQWRRRSSRQMEHSGRWQRPGPNSPRTQSSARCYPQLNCIQLRGPTGTPKGKQSRTAASRRGHRAERSCLFDSVSAKSADRRRGTLGRPDRRHRPRLCGCTHVWNSAACSGRSAICRPIEHPADGGCSHL